MEVLLNLQNKNVTLNAVHVAPEGTNCCNRLKVHFFKLDFNIAFGEYKDGLCKDGIISQSLYERATLY